MHSYIVLNEKKSTNVKGLLIQSLPPISKPLMRTSIEQIDGRDGDIVTKLGYSAYNKQFKIGLHGNYNVDEVIEYFDSEGTVTFSNEPDKFYNYQILSQIDFERLIRFRTATVTMHCQPFKYSAVDKALNFSGNNESMKVFNAGNIYAKPKITIFGSETINLSLNGNQIFVISLGTEERITIDSDKMEAYRDGILKNRQVVGDYDNLLLKPGRNTLTWNGNVEKISIENYSRWL